MKENKITWKGVWICAIAGLFCGFQYFIQVFPSTITDQLMRDLSLSANGVGLISGVFFFPYFIMQLPSGYLFDRFGPKITLSTSMLICALGCILFSMLQSPLGLVAGRILMGMGSAFSFIGAYALISRWLPIKWFAFFSGFVQMSCCIGAVFCQTSMTRLFDTYHWSTVHLKFGLVGLSLCLLYFLFIQSPPHFEKKKYTHKPIKIKSLLLNKDLLSMGLIILGSWVPVTVVASLWGIPFMIELFGVDKYAAASKLTYLWIGIGVGSLVLGFCANYVKSKLSLIDLSAWIALVATCLLIYGNLPFSQIGLVLFLIGFSGGIHPICFDAIQEKFPKEQHGTVFGFLNMAPCLSGLIFQPIVSCLLVWSWKGGIIENCPHYTRGEFQHVLWVVPCSAVICLISNQVLKRESKQKVLV